jgi:hypothetical protein
MGPGIDADTLMHKITDGYDCTWAFGLVVCHCDQDFPVLTFTVDGNPFNVTKNEYFQQNGDLCDLLISGSDVMDYWVFGDALLRKFYSVYDATNHRVGFADAKKSVPVTIAKN